MPSCHPLPAASAREHRAGMIAGMIAGAMSRMSRKRRALGRALVQDQHSAAVGRWVDTMILGLRLCPFAQPAAQRNGLKVVSSTGVTGDEVLEDLVTEGELLQADGEIATTLVVCPHVPEWQDFGSFHEFYAGELLNGRLLSRQLDLDVSIVAFHPSCSSSEVSVGLEVALQWQGQQWLAEVLEEDVSKELLSLRLLGQILETASSEDGGEDLAIQPLTEPQEAGLKALVFDDLVVLQIVFWRWAGPWLQVFWEDFASSLFGWDDPSVFLQNGGLAPILWSSRHLEIMFSFPN